MSALMILVFLALIAGVSCSHTSDCSYLSLLTHLNLTTKNDVLAIMRPVKNWTTLTIVQLDMVLYGILEVDEKSQTLTSQIWTSVTWMNEFLNWNPSDFCGINRLTVPMSMLWIPDICIQEDASDSGSIRMGPLASVYPDGMVYIGIRQRLTSTCRLMLWYFPFDTQNCNITFRSVSSAEERTLNLETYNSDEALTKISEMFMVTRGEWDLKNIEIYYNNVTSDGTTAPLTYMVTIVRKPLLYVINLIVPLLYLLVLDLASFFISEARGEKLSFKVTILLSISVLLLILQDMLPSTEDNLPMIASYCVAVFALVGISVLEAMLVSFLIDLDGNCSKKPQRSVDADVEIQLEVGCHKDPAGAENDEGQVKPGKGFLSLDGLDGRNLLKLILKEVKAARQEAAGQEKDKMKPGRYRRAAEIIDFVFFAFYFLTVVIFLTYMYKYWIKNV